jgi:hypothetical protein
MVPEMGRALVAKIITQTRSDRDLRDRRGGLKWLNKTC